MPIGVRIFAIGRDGSRHPAVSLAPAVYPRGVVDTQVNLAEGFGYLATVSIGSSGAVKASEYSFPIRVRAWYRALVMPFLLVLGVLALVAISIIRYRRSAVLRGRHRRAAAFMRLAGVVVALGICAAACHSAPKAAATLQIGRAHV